MRAAAGLQVHTFDLQHADASLAVLDGLRAAGLPAGVTLPAARRRTEADCQRLADGRVRLVAPTVDPTTRNGRVMVDVQANPQARAGMFARGEIVLGEAPVLTLPQSAVLLRDGFAYVFKVEADGKDSKVSKVRQIKVELGERQGDRVAVRSGVVQALWPVAARGFSR